MAPKLPLPRGWKRRLNLVVSLHWGHRMLLPETAQKRPLLPAQHRSGRYFDLGSVVSDSDRGITFDKRWPRETRLNFTDVLNHGSVKEN